MMYSYVLDVFLSQKDMVCTTFLKTKESLLLCVASEVALKRTACCLVLS